MRLDIIAAAAAIAMVAGTSTAEARRHRQSDEASYSNSYSRSSTRSSSRRGHVRYARSHDEDTGSRHSGVGPRPAAWCGWWMRTQRGGGPEFNLAANWKRYGSPSGPQVGAVVVWPHHVGEIVGRAADGRWLVRSGNDSGRVQTRARSVAGAVFRI